MRYERMNQSERREFDEALDDMVVGSPETCQQKIQDLAHDFGCVEIGIVTVTHRFEDRLRSYQLLARTFAITAI